MNGLLLVQLRIFLWIGFGLYWLLGVINLLLYYLLDLLLSDLMLGLGRTVLRIVERIGIRVEEARTSIAVVVLLRRVIGDAAVFNSSGINCLHPRSRVAS